MKNRREREGKPLSVFVFEKISPHTTHPPLNILYRPCHPGYFQNTGDCAEREREKIGGRLYKINVAAHKTRAHVKKKEKIKKRQKKVKKETVCTQMLCICYDKKINKKKIQKILPWARPEFLFYNKNIF